MPKIMASNQLVPIIFYLIAGVAGAFGQYFYKVGGIQLNSVPIYKNYPLFLGVILFCLVMVLFVAAFRLGGRMSVVYPVYATTFIWGMLIAVIWGKETITLSQVIGTLIIMIGVMLITITSGENV